MRDEKCENLHEQRYTIKFCVKLKKMVTEMKEMLGAAYNAFITGTKSFKAVERMRN